MEIYTQKDIPDLTPEQFRRFATLIHNVANINLKENKITLLSNRLRKRLKALALANFEDYYGLLTDPKRMDEELVYFLEVVTTNESYFWRTTQNFDMLREELLPEMLKRFRGETLRFWSAGCSTGEEPYNLAMELVEAMKRHGLFEFRILATDISKRVVDFAKAGVYSGRKIEKIPPAILQRYFRPTDREGFLEVRADIKEKIAFKLDNIFSIQPERQHCIFCRNVMIYFSRDDQEKLANRFYEILKPGGFLVIGHSESLHMMNTPLKSTHMKHGIVYYRPDEGLKL